MSQPIAPSTPPGENIAMQVPAKQDDEFVEEILKNENHAMAVMPESLRELTPEERNAIERRITRKIDFIVLPLIMVLYILNYIDRQNVSAAKLYGIMDDLNMDATQFSLVISILYVGYIPFQIPSNMIITKVSRPGLYISVAVLIWGTISSCTAAVQSYNGLLVARVFLGMVEAVFFPGVIYLLSAWYTKKELGKRLAMFYIAQQLGSGFGGLIAAGVLKLDGVHGIAGWRWLFIVEGVATVGCAIISCFLMPEYPHNAKILEPIERDLAVWRIEQEAGQGEAHEKVSTIRGFILALTDIKVLALVLCLIMSQAMNSALNYLPTIVATLGYSKTITLVLTAPPYMLAACVFYGLSWWSDRKMALYWPAMSTALVGLVAFIIPFASTTTGARYFAIMLTPTGALCCQVILYKTANLHIARPYPKRAAAVALMNAIGGTSNVWGSYLWTNGPHFYPGFGMCLGVVIAYAIIVTMYRFYVRRENKKLASFNEDLIMSAMKGGVTQEQVAMGWRYEGF